MRWVLFLSGIFLFSACATIDGLMQRAPEPEKAVLFFVPFYCADQKISEDLSKGFTDNLTARVELLKVDDFGLYLSSRSIQLPDRYIINGQITAETFDQMVNDLFSKDDVRENFYSLTKIDYLVMGSAVKQKQTDLEIGNIIETAESAQIKMLELSSGEILLQEGFKQGFFEIVAPDRIGKKLVSRVNDRLSQIYNELQLRNRRRHQQEYRLKREEWRNSPI